MVTTFLADIYVKSLTERNLSNKYFNISFKRLSDSYGSVTFKEKLTSQKYDCKFVAIATESNQQKVYITVVITKGQFWFGKEGNLIASKMLSCPSDEFIPMIESLRAITG